MKELDEIRDRLAIGWEEARFNNSIAVAFKVGFDSGAREMAKIKDAQIEKLVDALEFYADPGTYFAIGIFPDKPCGMFIEDFSSCEDEDLGEVYKPGKIARQALENFRSAAEDSETFRKEGSFDPEVK